MSRRTRRDVSSDVRSGAGAQTWGRAGPTSERARRIARGLFAVEDGELPLLHGFLKNT